VKARVKRGTIAGAALAAGCSAVAVAMRLIGGPDTIARYGVSLPLVIGVYLAGGAAGGALVGLLYPLRQARIGAMLLMTIAATPAYVGIAFAAEGPPSRWSPSAWVELAIICGIFGIFCGRLVYLPRHRQQADAMAGHQRSRR